MASVCKMNATSLTSLQLQNSKAVIQSKDATIQELKEKIAYLEAEVCVLKAPTQNWALKHRHRWGIGPVQQLVGRKYLGALLCGR